MGNADDTVTSQAPETVAIDKHEAKRSPLVFISHDTKDAALAEAFSKLLRVVSAGTLKSFRSSDKKGSQGIEYGTEWYPELMKKLSEATDVVCLLTPRSLDRPWLLYEAGVAKGMLNTPVLGIAIGITLKDTFSGPFAQFQNLDNDDDSLTKLMLQLLYRVPGSDPDAETVKAHVRKFRTEIDSTLNVNVSRMQGIDGEAISDDRSIARLFEEVKVMFHDLLARTKSRSPEGGGPVDRIRPRRLDPAMLEELSSLASDATEPLGLLMYAALFRDEAPWVYELFVDIYRDLRDGHEERARNTARSVFGVISKVRHNSIFEELGFDAGGSRQLLSFALEATEKYIAEITARRSKAWSSPTVEAPEAKDEDS